MFARAVLVLLLVLNVGVASWWATRAPSPAPVTIPAPPGVMRLQLLGEGPVAVVTPIAVPPASATQVPPGAATSPAMAAGAMAPLCFSFGPFGTDQAARAAQAQLQPLAERIVVREQRRGSARGWRVLLPALPDAEQAQAAAQRIAAAGFGDYFVVREGDEANSIALGRYGNETAARRRAETLVAAGFAARAEALGGAITWLDVRAAVGFDAAAAQQRAAAAERRSLDCAAFGGPGAPAR